MFANFYADAAHALAYAQIEFPGTYCLAFRDLPAILAKHVKGTEALDFGCGAGRSTRFLKNCGFRVTGIDIAPEMLKQARGLDPTGDYRLVTDGDYGSLNDAYDVVLCAFPLDNTPNDRKAAVLESLVGLIRPEGKIIILGSTPEIYLYEWVSFSTADFTYQNRKAKDGDPVHIMNLAAGDGQPVNDILCSDKTYRRIFSAAGLDVVDRIKPLAHQEEPFTWLNETRVAPWVIYVLKPSCGSRTR